MNKIYFLIRKKVIHICILLSIFCQNLYGLSPNFPSSEKRNALGNLKEVFVQRWAWQILCDYDYSDDMGALNVGGSPETIPAGSIVFATSYNFIRQVHPRIKNPYILITLLCGPTNEHIEDPKIIHWFGNIGHYDCINRPDKFTPIPIGINFAQIIFRNRFALNTLFKNLRSSPKERLAYMNISVHPHTPHRNAPYNYFREKSFCLTDGNRLFVDYIHETGKSKFTVSPTGDMFDCYRHWEALIVGTIPIINSSPLDRIFKGLPVVIVNSWDEITEDFLNKKYRETQRTNYDLRPLYMQYWVDKINEVRTRFFESQKTINKT